MTPSLVSQIKTLLDADATVFGIVAGRISPGKRRQDGATPYIVCNEITDNDAASLQGNSGGLENVVVQMDCYASTYEVANTLSEAIKAVFDSRTTVPKSTRVGLRKGYEDDTQLHYVSLDYSFWNG